MAVAYSHECRINNASISYFIWSFHLIIVISKSVSIYDAPGNFANTMLLSCCIVYQLQSINVEQEASSFVSDISHSPDSFSFGSRIQKMLMFFTDALVILCNSSLPANFHSKKTRKLSLFVIHWDVPQKMGINLLPRSMHPYSPSCNLMTERGLLFLKSLIRGGEAEFFIVH